MFKFITARCSCCGAVIYNLPEIVAELLKDTKHKCEDCSNNDFLERYKCKIAD